MKQINTICCYCGVGCGITLSQNAQGSITLAGNKEYPVNKGMLCSKGMNLHYTIMDRSDRLLYPAMRYNKHSKPQRVTWNQALERTAQVFRTFIEKYGPDSVAFYASGQCLTEEYYVLNKLVKGFIGTNNLDTNSRLCMSSAVVGYKHTLGEDSVPVCYDDIEETDCILVAGANPAWCHPILWRRVEAAKAANPGLKIIVTDPRRTQSCAIADLHLQLNPGTDVVLHYAIARLLIEQGNADLHFLKNHVDGYEAYKSAVFECAVEDAAIICGLEVQAIKDAATMIGQSKGLLTMWTMGLNQSVIGVNKNVSLIALNLITGRIGKPGCGPFSLTGQPNAMGGREVGGLSNLLPAHRNLFNPQHRQEVAEFWGVSGVNDKPGLTATEMFEALEDGRLKAIWILCTNPLHSLPDAARVEKALARARFVVLQEISNKPETMPYADVILPAAAWAEKQGTMTNAERRISMVNKLLEPPGEALPDAEIICRFAQKMGYKGFDFNHPSSIFEEHAQLTAGTNIDISQLTYAVLQQCGSVQWPYVNPGMGTKRLFENGMFYTDNQRAKLPVVPLANQSELLDSLFPLILTTGRLRDHWHTRSKTGKVNKLQQHQPEPLLYIHPTDARLRGIEDGRLVELSSRRGTIRVNARLDDNLKPGVLFLPMHWGKLQGSDLLRCNQLTHGLIDPQSKEPDFKYTAVQVRPYHKPLQKIIVIGAGAGAFGFVKSYRALNSADTIEVFSKEDFPFYNRVLLPDYISGSLPWHSLVKMTEEQEQALGITMHRGVSIEQVNTQTNTVTDSLGKAHSYDILILATGSRPFVLNGTPNMHGIFTMRSRRDADLFLQYKQQAPGRTIIIGGGLLGIELAASLKQIGVEVTIIQRISRLMDRQLDPLGSQLLHEELVERGVDIYYNDEVDRYLGTDRVEGVKLKSGLVIEGQAVVMAVGTVPNTELAKDAGIAVKRGVVVNAYLQTSVSNIYAIGEIAEYKGMLYGITAAAEQQAAVVAKHLQGDIATPYQGSLLMNILKMHGTELCSLGLAECPTEPGYEEVVFIDKAKRYYKKCIIHQDRMVGAILIGDKTEFLEYKNLIEQRVELSEKRLQLLRSGKQAEPVLGKLVCSCGNVGAGNIEKIIKNGCHDVVQLCQLSGAGMGCGSCRPEVAAMLEQMVNQGTALFTKHSMPTPVELEL
ncbi:MAG TPA: molybdopterin-dependent oxidoreductase [Phnomibacter sp.]|nr:molybdopterin-dependent oxidoreductase [Phnomibacter sp.]